MTSVDELFKKPSLPSGSIKRKFESPDAQEAYKATKFSANSSPNGVHANGATVEDAPGADNDIEAGPELPPENDEGDRFFGGGVTRDAAEAIDYIEGHDDESTFTEEKIDGSWLKRLTNSFGRKVNMNAELRARYDDEPQKFMSSEADLDAEIKSWSLLSEHPELYPDFADSEGPAMLVGLLAHENTDIAIGAIEVMSELLDEDVEAEQEEWDALVTALLNADLLSLLMSNLDRLEEEEEGDRSGVYHSLAVLENLGSQQSIAERVGTEAVLNWLCRRSAQAENPVSQNKQYAVEVLQVLLQSSPLLRRRLAVDVDGVDLFLQLLAAYRKRDPVKDSAEEEYAENLFDALTCVVDQDDGKSKFVEAEGVELCLIMLREGSFSKVRALRLLDHVSGGQGAVATAVCERLVDAAGLKTIFGIFMKRTDNATTEHLLGLFSSLLRQLPGESPARIRTLEKFREREHEKVKRLVNVRNDYARKLAIVDKHIREEQAQLTPQEAEQKTDEWFSRRLDGGLFCLQTADVVLAWLSAEDPGSESVIMKEIGSGAIKQSLQAQIDGLDAEGNQYEDTRDMLSTLISFLS